MRAASTRKRVASAMRAVCRGLPALSSLPAAASMRFARAIICFAALIRSRSIRTTCRSRCFSQSLASKMYGRSERRARIVRRFVSRKPAQRAANSVVVRIIMPHPRTGSADAQR